MDSIATVVLALHTTIRKCNARLLKKIVRLRISIPRNKEKGLENLICNTVDKHINWTFTQDSQAFQHRVIKPHDYFAARRSQKLFQAK